MPEDANSIQPEVASEGATSTAIPEVKAEGEQKQPLTEDTLNQRISEATKTFTEQVEAAKRELQSVKDKSKSEVERALREAQVHKEALSSFKSGLGDIDPEVSKNLELAELKARDKARQTVDYEQLLAQQQQALLETFNSNLTQYVTDMGVKPDDKRIDWGKDAPTLLEKQQRILVSLGKIHKEDSKVAEDRQETAFKEREAKWRKELGLDSVDTSNPVVSTSDVTWMEKWGSGEIEATPANLKRAMTLQKKLYGG